MRRKDVKKTGKAGIPAGVRSNTLGSTSTTGIDHGTAATSKGRHGDQMYPAGDINKGKSKPGK